MTDREPQHELVTHAEAAEILGCGVSNIPKLIRAGHLPSLGRRGHGRPSLERADVEQLADRRARAAAEREQRPPLQSKSRRPDPVHGHRWLSTVEAGAVIGITAQAIGKRCRRGTIPSAWHGGYWWIREDHARLAANVRATDSPEHVTIALNRLT